MYTASGVWCIAITSIHSILLIICMDVLDTNFLMALPCDVSCLVFRTRSSFEDMEDRRNWCPTSNCGIDFLIVKCHSRSRGRLLSSSYCRL